MSSLYERISYGNAHIFSFRIVDNHRIYVLDIVGVSRVYCHSSISVFVVLTASVGTVSAEQMLTSLKRGENRRHIFVFS